MRASPVLGMPGDEAFANGQIAVPSGSARGIIECDADIRLPSPAFERFRTSVCSMMILSQQAGTSSMPSCRLCNFEALGCRVVHDRNCGGPVVMEI